jgi:predicted tellurium resistance membrane protein TerC
LVISVPIMVWGSSLILSIVDRYPVVVYVGAGVLAWTAAVMLINEPLTEDWIAARPWLPWVVYALLVGGVLLAGLLRNRARGGREATSDSASGV